MTRLHLLLLLALTAALLAGCPMLVLDLGGDRGDDDAADDDTADDDTADDDTTAPDDDDTVEGPSLVVTPSSWQFEDHEVGCEQSISVWLTSVGSEDVVLDGITFSPGNGDLACELPEPPITITAGGTLELIVTYVPRDTSPDAALLAMTSNDPDGDEAIFTGEAHYADEAVETFEVEGTGLADLLWVVDSSYSGGTLQDQLAAAAADYIAELAALEVDYHLGVVTTDSGALQGPEAIITPSSSDPAALFAEAVAVGTAGSNTEAGLQYASEALTPPLAMPGGPNDGLLRDEAALRVFFLSDSDDESPDAVTAYVETLNGVKDSPSLVTLHALVAVATPRYEQAADSTGGLTVDTSSADWTTQLPSVAAASAHWLDTFALARLPVEEGLEVELDGVPVHEGWAYDPDLNAVVFDFPYVPDDGEVVTVSYPVLGGC